MMKAYHFFEPYALHQECKKRGLLPERTRTEVVKQLLRYDKSKMVRDHSTYADFNDPNGVIRIAQAESLMKWKVHRHKSIEGPVTWEISKLKFKAQRQIILAQQEGDQADKKEYEADMKYLKGRAAIVKEYEDRVHEINENVRGRKTPLQEQRAKIAAEVRNLRPRPTFWLYNWKDKHANHSAVNKTAGKT